MNMKKKREKAIAYFIGEYQYAITKHEPFNSEHEGYAVIKEEFDEFWDAIKLKQSNPCRKQKVHEEAVQVGAMILRFMVDCCYKDE